jgi:hypothetical protein
LHHYRFLLQQRLLLQYSSSRAADRLCVGLFQMHLYVKTTCVFRERELHTCILKRLGFFYPRRFPRTIVQQDVSTMNILVLRLIKLHSLLLGIRIGVYMRRFPVTIVQ